MQDLKDFIKKHNEILEKKLSKTLGKIQRKLETMDKRLVKLEQRKCRSPQKVPKKVEEQKLPYHVGVFNIGKGSCDVSQALLLDDIATCKNNYKLFQRPGKFRKYVTAYLSNPVNMNYHLQGERLYTYESTGWEVVTGKVKFLKELRKVLWKHYNAIFKEYFCDEEFAVDQKRMQVVYETNTSRECPMSNQQVLSVIKNNRNTTKIHYKTLR